MFYDRPIFFEKNRVNRVYSGGKLFADFFGDDSTEGFYPEEWVASCVRALNEGSKDKYEGVSKIEGENIYLNDAVELYNREITGDKGGIEILTKILNSSVRLPVQAHPDKAFSKKYFNSKYGKEECWIILATEPGAKIFYGFKDGVTAEIFEKAIDASENSKSVMEELLVSYTVKSGDVIYIPAKMVHAIGAGCLLLEVQEPSDFTVQPERWCAEYRLSDNEMYLGLDKQRAVECFDIEKKFSIPIEPSVIYETDAVRYISFIDEKITNAFTVRSIRLNGGRFDLDKGCAVYVVTDGKGVILGDGYERTIKKGEYFLITDIIKNKFFISGNITVVECYK